MIDFRLAALTLVLALAMFRPGALPAQPRPGDAGVRGVVTGADDLPITLAVVELRFRGDSGAARTTQSGEAGRFQFDGVAEGAYYLLIRRIGFGPVQTLEFTVAAGQVRNLGIIRLQPSTLELAPIVVTVERPDVQFEPDRTGYLVEALTGAAGGVITDALRGIPDLAVEFDGTVRLRGSTPAIYINGRPAPMQGQSLSVFMEQFPADQIERIEVLDNPPARFNAEGSAGIINIVLKEGVELGVSGSLSLAAGTRGQRTASGRATLQRGPWVFNGGLNTRWSDSETADFTLRQNLLATPTTFLQQESRSDRANRSGGGSIDVRYDFSPKARVWTRIGGDLNGSDRSGFTATTHLDAARDPTLWYDRLSRSSSSGGSAHAMAGYMYSWQAERHALEIQASGHLNESRSDDRDETDADPVFQDDALLPAWLTRRDNGSSNDEIGLEVQYTRPWGRQGRVDVGTAFRRDESRDDQSTTRFEAPEAPVPDEVEVRDVSRVQRITSGYLSLQRRLGPINLNAGLRGEVVRSDVILATGEVIPRDESDLFPNLNLSWSPRQRMALRLGYSRRINRPGVSVLDPTDRSTDPLNRSVGNPGIKSSFSHNLTANFTWTGRLGQFSLGPYWNQTNDGWERITTVDAAGISTSTWANLTSRTSVGASVSAGPAPIKGWRGRLNLSASRSTLSGTIRGEGATDGQLLWSASANLDGTILGLLMVQGSFGYQPPREQVQGRTSGQWRADMGFRYRTMGNRTSLSLSLQDPFLLRKSSQEIRDPSVIQTGRSSVTSRSMTLTASYAFGRTGPRR